MKQRQLWVSYKTPHLSTRQKCQLLSVNRSSLYYQTHPVIDDVTLMNEIADIYAKRPFQGYKRVARDLRDRGHVVNHKKVYRLKTQMRLDTIHPKKNLSKRRQEDAVYPYLLSQNPPLKPHDCWCVDITYIKLSKGFVYLTALIDVVSRCIMGWHLSTQLDATSCLDALDMAIQTGYRPKIINSDQGCQFTSQEWVYSLRLLGVQISMDGKGRCLDNIPIERFWRTLKYEEVYLKSYESVREAKAEIKAYIHWYNHERRHGSLDYKRPYEMMKNFELSEKIRKKLIFHPMNKPVENSSSLHTRFIHTTTTTTKQNNNIKNRKELSLQIAA